MRRRRGETEFDAAFEFGTSSRHVRMGLLSFNKHTSLCNVVRTNAASPHGVLCRGYRLEVASFGLQADKSETGGNGSPLRFSVVHGSERSLDNTLHNSV